MTEEEKVLTLIRDRVLKDLPGPIDLYLSKKGRDNCTIATWAEDVRPPADLRERLGLWIAFVDLKPGANFDHPVKYVFIDADSGDFEVLDKLTPPNDLFDSYKKHVGFVKGSGR
ncbi:MAG: hypothetical protein LJE60_01900 [Thiocapsa sp.]|nr:hypothetical protein [Thiocapsa sp.]MCG6895851.1 hypothetical protein [Thiocapsa sp.]